MCVALHCAVLRNFYPPAGWGVVRSTLYPRAMGWHLWGRHPTAPTKLCRHKSSRSSVVLCRVGATRADKGATRSLTHPLPLIGVDNASRGNPFTRNPFLRLLPNPPTPPPTLPRPAPRPAWTKTRSRTRDVSALSVCFLLLFLSNVPFYVATCRATSSRSARWTRSSASSRRASGRWASALGTSSPCST